MTDYRLPAAPLIDQVQFCIRLGYQPAQSNSQAPFVERSIDHNAIDGQTVAVLVVDDDNISLGGVVLMHAPYGAGNVEDHDTKTQHQHHDAEEQFLADIMLLRLLFHLLQKTHTSSAPLIFSCSEPLRFDGTQPLHEVISSFAQGQKGDEGDKGRLKS